MKKMLSELKNVIPIDYNYLNYIRRLSPSIEYNQKNKISIFVAFVASLLMANTILAYFQLTIKLNEAVNFQYLLKLYILNAVMFASILSVIIFIVLKNLRLAFFYFIQVIKFYSIVNLTLSLLFVFFINITVNSFENIDNTLLHSLVLIIFVVNFYLIYKFLFLEIYKLKYFTSYRWLKALAIISLTMILNVIAYEVLGYNTPNINELFKKEIICEQINKRMYDIRNDNPNKIQNNLNRCEYIFSKNI